MLAADPDGKAPWVVLTVKTGALTAADGTPVTEALRQARAAAEKVSEGSEVLAFGPALIAEHAVGRASRESSLHGDGVRCGAHAFDPCFFAQRAGGLSDPCNAGREFYGRPLPWCGLPSAAFT